MRLVFGRSLAFAACVFVACVFAACASTPSSPAAASLESWEKKWEQWEKQKPAGRGNLFIHCEPEDAEILLDGIPQGTCLDYASKGLQINESSEPRKIVVAKAGYWPYEAMISLDRSKMNLRVQLQAMQASVDP
jgi:hypothetical protein